VGKHSDQDEKNENECYKEKSLVEVKIVEDKNVDRNGDRNGEFNDEKDDISLNNEEENNPDSSICNDKMIGSGMKRPCKTIIIAVTLTPEGSNDKNDNENNKIFTNHLQSRSEIFCK